jgi:hypothetical protein
VRSMGQCMAMGQAAGAAGALASAQSLLPSELPVEKLQASLREIGALF